jgi:hypothetical protein
VHQGHAAHRPDAELRAVSDRGEHRGRTASERLADELGLGDGLQRAPRHRGWHDVDLAVVGDREVDMIAIIAMGESGFVLLEHDHVGLEPVVVLELDEVVGGGSGFGGPGSAGSGGCELVGTAPGRGAVTDSAGVVDRDPIRAGVAFDGPHRSGRQDRGQRDPALGQEMVSFLADRWCSCHCGFSSWSLVRYSSSTSGYAHHRHQGQLRVEPGARRDGARFEVAGAQIDGARHRRRVDALTVHCSTSHPPSWFVPRVHVRVAIWARFEDA